MLPGEEEDEEEQSWAWEDVEDEEREDAEEEEKDGWTVAGLSYFLGGGGSSVFGEWWPGEGQRAPGATFFSPSRNLVTSFLALGFSVSLTCMTPPCPTFWTGDHSPWSGGWWRQHWHWNWRPCWIPSLCWPAPTGKTSCHPGTQRCRYVWPKTPSGTWFLRGALRRSTHHQLLDESFSFTDHLSELRDHVEVLWAAFSVPQLLFCALQPVRNRSLSFSNGHGSK